MCVCVFIYNDDLTALKGFQRNLAGLDMVTRNSGLPEDFPEDCHSSWELLAAGRAVLGAHERH